MTTNQSPLSITVVTAEDMADWDKQAAEDYAGCVITRDANPSLDLLYGGYRYEILFKRINTPIKVLAWIAHLSEKTWMTPRRIEVFIERCAQVNRWPADWRRV